MSLASFDDFLATRPDEERWELVAGRPVSKKAKTIVHSVLASNVERILHDALARTRPDLFACRNVAVVMERSGVEGCDLRVPDVSVLGVADLRDGVDRTSIFFAAVEIVGPPRSEIGLGLEAYEASPTCGCTMAVDGIGMRIVLALRNGDGWSRTEHAHPDDAVVVPDFGLSCTVADVYARTPLLHGLIRPRDGV